MSSLPSCRVQGLLAEKANQVVLFRRGPSKQFQQLIWDLTSDTITPGQWLKAQVYASWSDVSPDGRYLVYSALQPGPYRPNDRKPATDMGHSYYTAVSRPPFFTALALWFHLSTNGRGGVWSDECHLLIDDSFHGPWDESLSPSSKITVSTLKEFPARSRRGWVSIRDELTKRRTQSWRLETYVPFNEEALAAANLSVKTLRKVREEIPPWQERMGTLTAKTFAGGFILKERLRHVETAYAFDESGRLLRTWAPIKAIADAWIEVDAAGKMIFADEGMLYRWPDFPHGEPEIIADLTPNRFEQVPPPDWALTW